MRPSPKTHVAEGWAVGPRQRAAHSKALPRA
jgi:hypothetical protein